MDFKINNPQFKHGYLYAVRLLTVGKRSSSELSTRLAEKGYSGETVQQVIEILKTQGILNDQRLIRETVQWAVQAKRYGRRRISLELKKRKVNAGEIEKALMEYPKNVEQETARMLAEERWLKLKKVEPQKRKKRVYDFLINRGFDFELSREVVTHMQSGT